MNCWSLKRRWESALCASRYSSQSSFHCNMPTSDKASTALHQLVRALFAIVNDRPQFAYMPQA